MSASEPRRGAYLERQAQAALRADGYWTMKAPGSKGEGAVDLVALTPGLALLVQCKLSGYMTPAERADLWNAALKAGAVPLMVKRAGPGKLSWFQLTAPVGAPLAVWVPVQLDEVA